MGYGTDHESIEFSEDDLDVNRSLTDFEKLLRYHEISKEEFFELSGNEQSRMRWNYNKFGRKRN